MKDAEFIELLNLYLDHEISAADAARLEAEVAANPARRRTYEEYCRMQKACKLLGAEYAESAPVAGKVVNFQPARSTGIGVGWWAGAGALAAACVAVIFLVGRQSGPSEEGSPSLAGVSDVKPLPTTVAAVSGRTIPQTVSMPVRSEEPKVGIAAALSLGGGARQSVERPLFVGAERNSADFAWLSTVEIAPMQRASLDDYRFGEANSLRRDNRTPAPRQPGQGTMEWNAIRWQK